MSKTNKLGGVRGALEAVHFQRHGAAENGSSKILPALTSQHRPSFLHAKASLSRAFDPFDPPSLS